MAERQLPVGARPGGGGIKSLGRRGRGPVGLICAQKVQFFWKKNPTSVVESYKTTYRHKADISGLDVRCHHVQVSVLKIYTPSRYRLAQRL